MTLTQKLFEFFSLWKDAPVVLKIGIPSQSAPSFTFEPDSGRPVDSVLSDGHQLLAYYFTLRMRGRPDGDPDMLDLAALCDSLLAFAAANDPPAPLIGSSPVIEQLSTPVYKRLASGFYDCELRMRYTWHSANTADGYAPDGGDDGSVYTEPVALRFKTGDQTVAVSAGGEYNLTGVDGLEAGGSEITLRSPVTRDGKYAGGVKRGERTITAVFDFDEYGNIDDYGGIGRRDYIISALAPSRSGTLMVTRGTVSRSIDFIVDKAEYDSGGVKGHTSVKLTVVCPDPYFRDADPSVFLLRSVTPLFTFPFNSTASAGTTASLAKSVGSAVINNTGHTDAGVKITLTALSEAVDPVVSDGTNSISLHDTLSPGDVYVIDTAPQSRTVTKNGEDSFLFDRRSVFFMLPAGQSMISVSTESGSEALDVMISCPFRYYGI